MGDQRTYDSRRLHALRMRWPRYATQNTARTPDRRRSKGKTGRGQARQASPTWVAQAFQGTAAPRRPRSKQVVQQPWGRPRHGDEDGSPRSPKPNKATNPPRGREARSAGPGGVGTRQGGGVVGTWRAALGKMKIGHRTSCVAT